MIKLLKGLLIAGLLLLPTGCWSRKELNELAIAVAIGFDRAENGRLDVSVQFVNPGEIATRMSVGPGQSPVTTFHETGASVYEALRKMTTKLSRRVYLSHIRMLVIGEELAREGISETLDFLSRHHEIRTDFYIVVARQTKALDALAVLTPQNKVPADKLYSSLEISEKLWAATDQITLDVLINDLQSEGKSPVLTGLAIDGPVQEGKALKNVQAARVPTILRYRGMAVFRGDTLVGWLNQNESKGYNYTQGHVKNTIVASACDNGVVEVELMKTEANIRVLPSSGELPEIVIDVRAEGNVGDITCDLDLQSPDSIVEVERISEQNIRNKIEQAIAKAQQSLHTDIFGFGEAIHRTDPKRWRSLKHDWETRFPELTVRTKVKLDIQRVGTIGKPVELRVRK